MRVVSTSTVGIGMWGMKTMRNMSQMVVIEPGTILNMENIRPKGDKMSDPVKELNNRWKDEYDDLMQDYKEVCKENEKLLSKIESSSDLNMSLAVTIDELLYEKDNVAAYSDNDFVKWQEYRQGMEEKLAAMTYNYGHLYAEKKILVERINALQDEMAYWQREAMKNQGRD